MNNDDPVLDAAAAAAAAGGLPPAPQDLNIPGPGNGNNAGGANHQVAAVDVVTLKSHFKIPEYSGLAKGTTFTGATGPRTEMLSIQSFIQQVTTIKGAAKWDDAVTAQYVKLSFLPETPIHDFALNNKDKDFMNTWTLMAPTLLKEFATFVSVSDKVTIFKQFKQKPNELAKAYLYRITREYNRFIEDLDTMMTAQGQPWHQEDDASKQARKKIVAFVTDFHLMNFFAFGLRPTTLEDVTRSGKTELSDMLNEATKSEQAQQQSIRRTTVAEVAAQEAPSSVPDARAAEAPLIHEDLIISAIRKFAQKKQGNRNTSKDKSVSCFYCGIARHKANECRKRMKDRASGIWRQKITDTPTSKADWEKTLKTSNSTARVSTIAADHSAEQEYYDFFAKN